MTKNLSAKELNRLVDVQREDAAHLAALEDLYLRFIHRAGRHAASALRKTARVGTVTASPWQPPPEGLLFDPDEAAATVTADAASTHRRIFKDVAGKVLGFAGIAWDVKSPFARHFLDGLGQRTGALLGQGVQPVIAKTVADAYDRGLSVPDTAALITENVADAGIVQARMLARTDLNGLANGASVMAATLVGVQYKQWLTAEDDLVRDTHAEADGQTVPVDEPFDVGGEQLDYPGDPSGSDAEVCNCRCSVIYVDASDAGVPEQDGAASDALPIDVPGQEIPQAERYYHGTGGGPALTVGNEKWDSKYFVTPDQNVAQHYADRHADGIVQEVNLDKSVRVFKPELDPIEYTPDKLVSIIGDAEKAGFGAVHFGGGIGTVILNRASASVVKDVTASSSPVGRVPSRGMATAGKQARSKFGAAPARNTVAPVDAIRVPARGFATRPPTVPRVPRMPGRGVAAAVTITVDEPQAAEMAWTADLAFEGAATEDGRYILPDALGWRDLPLSLGAMLDTSHADVVTEAPVIGRIDAITKQPSGGMTALRGTGVFDVNGDQGAEIARMVSEEMLNGVSIDLAVDDWCFRNPETGDLIEPYEMGPAEMEQAMMGSLQYAVRAGTIMGATVCPNPAFADARIAVTASGRPILRLWSPLEVEGGALTASAAGLAPAKPPSAWFATPEADEPTPLTVTSDGRVFGHMALWDSCHTGYPGQCVPPPRSPSGYAYFNLGEIECADGSRVAAGALTLDGLHADTDRPLSPQAVRRHYEDTGMVAAFVKAVDGRHGIWVAGTLRADLPERYARDLMGAKPSGDWRQLRPGGPLEMLGVRAVNFPGFPVPRMVAAAMAPSGVRAELQFAES